MLQGVIIGVLVMDDYTLERHEGVSYGNLFNDIVTP